MRTWPERRTVRTVIGVALLFLVLAMICAPLSPLFDPDEGYYPATAAESLRSGAFWDLRFNGAPRWDKPVLSYALIEIAISAFGDSTAAARIPSAVEGALLVALVGLLVARLAPARAGVLSAVVVGTSLGVSIFSRVAHPELALVTSVIAVELLFCLWLTESSARARRWISVAAGVAVGLGLLTKGPVAAILPVLTMAAALPFLSVERHRLRSLMTDALLGALVAAAVAVPWYLAMTIRHGTVFLREAVWQQNVGRYTSGIYGHGASAGSILLPALVGLFPWTAFLPQAVGRLPLKASGTRDVLRVTMVASAVTAVAFYSLSSSKLPSYALVAVPPLAIVVGLWLDQDLDRLRPTRAAWTQTVVLLGVAASVLLSAPLWIGRIFTVRQLFGAFRPEYSDVSDLLAPVAVPVGALLAGTLILLLWSRQLRHRIAVVATLGTAIPLLVLVCARPLLESMYPWHQLAPLIDPGHGRVWMVGRRAPSLTFYARQDLSVLAAGDDLEPLVQQEREGWLALTRDDWAHFASTDAARHAHATLVAEHGRMVLVRFKS